MSKKTADVDLVCTKRSFLFELIASTKKMLNFCTLYNVMSYFTTPILQKLGHYET